MILEHALLPVRPGQEADFERAFATATTIISAVPGFRNLTLSRCVERPGGYLLLVEWDRQGRLRSRSIHNYGSATLDARSPHYADQAPLFARQELKPVWMDEADIRAHLEREYRPGEPGR